jgi:hypothetical protein
MEHGARARLMRTVRSHFICTLVTVAGSSHHEPEWITFLSSRPTSCPVVGVAFSDCNSHPTLNIAACQRALVGPCAQHDSSEGFVCCLLCLQSFQYLSFNPDRGSGCRGLSCSCWHPARWAGFRRLHHLECSCKPVRCTGSIARAYCMQKHMAYSSLGFNAQVMPGTCSCNCKWVMQAWFFSVNCI